MDQRVVLQVRQDVRDDHGQQVGAWVPLATVWAAIKPFRGREYLAAGQMQEGAQMVVTVRWRADVSSANRLVWRGEIFDITDAQEAHAGRVSIDLMCRRAKV